MTSQTTERAFESYVEQMLLAKGWLPGNVSGWDQERALFPRSANRSSRTGCNGCCP